MDDKQKLSDFLLIKLQECKLKPYGGAIYGDAADHIAKQLVCAGYRKQSDAISEFVLQLIERFKNTETIANCLHGRSNTEINQIIKIVAAEFGAEVKE